MSKAWLCAASSWALWSASSCDRASSACPVSRTRIDSLCRWVENGLIQCLSLHLRFENGMFQCLGFAPGFVCNPPCSIADCLLHHRVSVEVLFDRRLPDSFVGGLLQYVDDVFAVALVDCGPGAPKSASCPFCKKAISLCLSLLEREDAVMDLLEVSLHSHNVLPRVCDLLFAAVGDGAQVCTLAPNSVLVSVRQQTVVLD